MKPNEPKKGEQKKIENKTSNIREELIKDYEVTGELAEEKSMKFAIVSMSNGKKALLETDRVWINDKPKFGQWRALHLSYFKKMSINARKIEGFADFEYQVIFAHSGFYKKNPVGRYDYSPKMIEWIKKVTSYPQLDEELKIYKSQHCK